MPMGLECKSCGAEFDFARIRCETLRYCPSCGSDNIKVNEPDMTLFDDNTAFAKVDSEGFVTELKSIDELEKHIDSCGPGLCCETCEPGCELKEVKMIKELTMELDCFGREDNAGKMFPCAPILASDADFKYEVKGAPEQGTDEWLAWRKEGITATEAGMIMYPSKYGSGLKVFTDKLGLTVNDQSDPDGFMEWGHRIEDLLVKKFMEQHPDFACPTQGRLYQRGWCKCSLDAQAFDAEGNPVIIECKTGQHEDKWNPIPEKYYAQVQWQMYVTGIRKAYFSVLIQGHTWFEKEVDFCPAYVEELLKKCFYIWDCIQNQTPPNIFTGGDADKSAISALAGETGHGGEPEEVDQETVETYLALKKQYEEAEEAFTNFKNKLGFKMIEASKLTCDGRTFATWVERKGAQSIDKVRLQQMYPDVYKDCIKQGPPTRYVRYSV